MRNKKQKPKNGKVYIGARVPEDLQARLERRARREHRSVAAIIELVLTKEVAME